jgi:hypothetical protein
MVEECDAVIHTVGALLDGDYKNFIKDIESGEIFRNPRKATMKMMEEIVKMQTSIPTTTYE